ncbi:MAG: hypothetical protein ABI041_18780 [Bdellovibrionia bacterium]
MLPGADLFWGPSSYSYFQITDQINLFTTALSILARSDSTSFYYYFLMLQIISLIFGIFGICPLLCSILVYFLTINLDNKAWPTLNGGNNLVHIQLLYLIVIELGLSVNRQLKRYNVNQGSVYELFNGLANFGFLTARIQLVIVYVVSGLTKLKGALWIHGVALYYVFNTEAYSHPLAVKYIATSDFLIVAGTYFTLIFQLGFPWLIWIRKFRKVLIPMGTFLHMQIAFVMGLMDFGFAMSVMYLLFLTEDRASIIINYWQPKSVLFVHCPTIGSKLALKLVKLFDFSDRINTLDQNIERCPSACSEERFFFGIEIGIEITKRIPILLPLVPILMILKITDFGSLSRRKSFNLNVERINKPEQILMKKELRDLI